MTLRNINLWKETFNFVEASTEVDGETALVPPVANANAPKSLQTATPGPERPGLKEPPNHPHSLRHAMSGPRHPPSTSKKTQSPGPNTSHLTSSHLTCVGILAGCVHSDPQLQSSPSRKPHQQLNSSPRSYPQTPLSLLFLSHARSPATRENPFQIRPPIIFTSTSASANPDIRKSINPNPDATKPRANPKPVRKPNTHPRYLPSLANLISVRDSPGSSPHKRSTETPEPRLHTLTLPLSSLRLPPIPLRHPPPRAPSSPSTLPPCPARKILTRRSPPNVGIRISLYSPARDPRIQP